MDILEKLQQIADAVPGGPTPEVISGPNWGAALSKVAKEAVAEIERLRAVAGKAQPSSFNDLKSLKEQNHGRENQD